MVLAGPSKRLKSLERNRVVVAGHNSNAQVKAAVQSWCFSPSPNKLPKVFVDFELVGADRPGVKAGSIRILTPDTAISSSLESRRTPTPGIAEHTTDANVGFAGQCGSFTLSRGSGPGTNPAGRLSASQSQGHNQIPTGERCMRLVERPTRQRHDLLVAIKRLDGELMMNCSFSPDACQWANRGRNRSSTGW